MNKAKINKIIKNLPVKSQAELARLIGVNKQSVSSWIIGSRNPSRMTQRFLWLLDQRPELIELLRGWDGSDQTD